MKPVLREVGRTLLFAVVAAAVFSALFILGHLAVYQELPRWK